LLFKIQRLACSSCSVFTDFAACSTPHSGHASMFTPSLGRWAAARVCFPQDVVSQASPEMSDYHISVHPARRCFVPVRYTLPCQAYNI